MDPLLIGLLALAALSVLLAAGLPVAVALGGIGVLGAGLTVGWSYTLANVQSLPHGFASSYLWTTLPLFVLMGSFAAESGVTVDLFRSAHYLLQRVRGGLYLAVVASSALFSAISGSTVVNAVVFTRLALPEMLNLGYSRSLSLGCICASGTFAAMIPPSLTLVMLGLLTDQSIGKLFVAGIVPGLISALVYAFVLLALVRWRPDLAPVVKRTEMTRQEGRASLGRSWPAVALFLLVLGGIYLGWFAPSSAGAVGAFGAFLLCLMRRRGTGAWLPQALRDTLGVTCSILMILIGGLFFSRFLVVAGTVDAVIQWVSVSADPVWLMLGLVLFYLLLGMILDTASIMIVTLPIVFPLAIEAGIEPLWFSILLVKLIEVAVFSPPIGINLFATLSAAGKDGNLRSLYRGVTPFLFAEIINLLILFLFPALTTWLPEHMLGS